MIDFQTVLSLQEKLVNYNVLRRKIDNIIGKYQCSNMLKMQRLIGKSFKVVMQVKTLVTNILVTEKYSLVGKNEKFGQKMHYSKQKLSP